MLVVFILVLDLEAADAAGLVDLLNSQFCAVGNVQAIDGSAAGDGADLADHPLCIGGAGFFCFCSCLCFSSCSVSRCCRSAGRRTAAAACQSTGCQHESQHESHKLFHFHNSFLL